jgi:hypothetical protein
MSTSTLGTVYLVMRVLGLLGGLLLAAASLGVALYSAIRRSNRGAAWLLFACYSLALAMNVLSIGISAGSAMAFNRLGAHGISWVYLAVSLLGWPMMVGVGLALALFRPSQSASPNDGTSA